jgi:hypothetical protein
VVAPAVAQLVGHLDTIEHDVAGIHAEDWAALDLPDLLTIAARVGAIGREVLACVEATMASRIRDQAAAG